DITERKRAEELLSGAAAHQSGEQSKGIVKEIAVIAGIAALVFAGGYFFGWFEWIVPIIADSAAHPFADEMIALIAILLPCLAVFSFRRWGESRAEVVSQNNVATALRTLH